MILTKDEVKKYIETIDIDELVKLNTKNIYIKKSVEYDLLNILEKRGLDSNLIRIEYSLLNNNFEMYKKVKDPTYLNYIVYFLMKNKYILNTIDDQFLNQVLKDCYYSTISFIHIIDHCNENKLIRVLLNYDFKILFINESENVLELDFLIDKNSKIGSLLFLKGTELTFNNDETIDKIKKSIKEIYKESSEKDRYNILKLIKNCPYKDIFNLNNSIEK